MTVSPAFSTLSVKVPSALAARVAGYTLAHNDTVSGFIKTAILQALGDYQCDTPIPMEVSKTEADAVITKVGKVLAATVGMPPTKRASTLAVLLTVVANAKEHFNMVAATDARYAGSYKSLLLQVRNAHRAAETRALSTPAAVTPTGAAQLPPRPPTTGAKPAEGEAWNSRMVTPEELAVLGMPRDYHARWLEYSEKYSQEWVIDNVLWLRGHGCGSMMPDLPTVRYPGDTEFLVWAIAKAEAAKNTKVAAYCRQVQDHLATLTP